MARAEAKSVRHYVELGSADRFLFDRAAQVRVADLARGASFRGGLDDLAGRSVLIATSSQLTSALALIELDGVVRRITILPPDVDRAHLNALISDAEIDAVVIDIAATLTVRPKKRQSVDPFCQSSVLCGTVEEYDAVTRSEPCHEHQHHANA